MNKIRFLAVGVILVALTILVGSTPLAQAPSEMPIACLGTIVDDKTVSSRELLGRTTCSVGAGLLASCTCDNLTVNLNADLTDGEIKQVNTIRGDQEYIDFLAAGGAARGIRVGEMGVDSSYSNADAKLDYLTGNSLWVKDKIWAGGDLWAENNLSIYGTAQIGKPNTGEGGEITLRPGSSGNSWSIDNYYGQFRLHHDGTAYLLVGATGGIEATTANSMGIHGVSTSSVGSGVYGQGTGTNGKGTYGRGRFGVYGYSPNSNGIGVTGYANQGAQAIGVWGFSQNGTAGVFDGNVSVAGIFTASDKRFRIDHPLDPANSYLYHGTVESAEMKNMYDGTTVLDVQGEAVVNLPTWFQAVNQDFRYQLTCIGDYAPIYIAEEINNNQFKIAGGKPGIKVSWQVTGIRHDPWANDHPLQVEVDKGNERGTYLYPKGYGQPEDLGVDYQRRQSLQQSESD